MPRCAISLRVQRHLARYHHSIPHGDTVIYVGCGYGLTPIYHPGEGYFRHLIGHEGVEWGDDVIRQTCSPHPVLHSLKVASNLDIMAQSCYMLNKS